MPQQRTLKMENWLDALLPKLPGIFGSALALTWIQGKWSRKFILMAGGGGAAFYLAPWVSHLTGFQGEGVGFIVGMFSMAAADVVFRSMQALMIGAIINDWIRHKLGLPHKDSHDA